MNNNIIKFNRLSAWLLMALMILYFFTGLDALKNFWQPELSRYLHDKILPLPTLFLVFFHSAIGLKFFLLRHQLNDKRLNYFLFASLAILLLLLLYLFWQ